MEKMKTILVTGATGQQGGAVIRHLLKDGWSVRALVRDENKPASQELKKLGVEIIQGDMNDRVSIDKAMADVYGVFSVQNYWEHGYDGELKQGLAVADSASEAGVKHFVQSSVGGAERSTNLPHFDVKFEIENHVKALKLPATIIRPVYFMENLSTFNAPAEANGKHVFNIAMKPDSKLQMIAVDDIGAITAVVFGNPDEYIGREIEIAGDELTMPQVAEVFSKVTGKETVFNEMPMEDLRNYNEEFANMFQWFIDKGYKADIQAVKKIYPGLHNLESWLASKNDKT
jgi:uncharacterized protein YbjT (DUF2867 family)